ncbi:MAG: HAD family hydrolase [Armatimonadota bacterium]|nr:HAD family hydrolase [Armatimonadota bacterium]
MRPDAIFFDMVGCIEEVRSTSDDRARARRRLHRLLAEIGVGLPMRVFEPAFITGREAYYRWRDEALRELPPEQIWLDYFLRDLLDDRGREAVAQAAETLMVAYDESYYRRRLRPGVRRVLQVLRRRGYRLGIISNVCSRTVVPRNLRRYGIADRFEAVVLSSVTTHRKPGTAIFHIAADLLGVPPDRCAYVGDTINRDINGAAAAGFGITVLIPSALTAEKDEGLAHRAVPTHVIGEFRELLGVFP